MSPGCGSGTLASGKMSAPGRSASQPVTVRMSGEKWARERAAPTRSEHAHTDDSEWACIVSLRSLRTANEGAVLHDWERAMRSPSGLKPLPTRSDAVTLTCCLPAATRDAPSLPHPFPVPTLLPRQASHPSPRPHLWNACESQPLPRRLSPGGYHFTRSEYLRSVPASAFSVSCACPSPSVRTRAPISSRLTAGDDDPTSCRTRASRRTATASGW